MVMVCEREEQSDTQQDGGGAAPQPQPTVFAVVCELVRRLAERDLVYPLCGSVRCLADAADESGDLLERERVGSCSKGV